jgi:hypothetical protein
MRAVPQKRVLSPTGSSSVNLRMAEPGRWKLVEKFILILIQDRCLFTVFGGRIGKVLMRPLVLATSPHVRIGTTAQAAQRPGTPTTGVV